MIDTGFSLQCPHCQEWTDYTIDPDEVVIETTKQLLDMLDQRRKDPSFFPAEFFRCSQDTWKCPSPFEAYLCRTEAVRDFKGIDYGRSPRSFRPYYNDHQRRWENYTCMLYFVEPIQRQKQILLGTVLKPEYISKFLVGLSQEIGAPVTAYLGNVYENDTTCDVHWLPIEQESEGSPYVPSGYNPICEIIRNSVIQGLLNKYAGKCHPERCLKDYGRRGLCAGQVAYCREKNLNWCPVFLEAREKKDTCYASDKELIKSLISECFKGDYSGWSCHECWLGLRDFAAPIVVHDILVGVLMTGQFAFNDQPLTGIGQIVKKVKGLSLSEKQRLSRLFKVIRGEYPKSPEERLTTSFLISDKDQSRITEALKRGADLLAKTASNSYHDFRVKSESFFKSELLELREHAEGGKTSEQRTIQLLLKRLREFWGFIAVYLIKLSRQDNSVLILSHSSKAKPEGILKAPKLFGKLLLPYKLIHPVHFLYDKTEEYYPASDYGEQLFRYLEDEIWDDDALEVPDGRYYFGVASPFEEYDLFLLYAVRDPKACCDLPEVEKGGMSPMCRELVRSTSIDVLMHINAKIM